MAVRLDGAAACFFHRTRQNTPPAPLRTAGQAAGNERTDPSLVHLDANEWPIVGCGDRAKEERGGGIAGGVDDQIALGNRCSLRCMDARGALPVQVLVDDCDVSAGRYMKQMALETMHFPEADIAPIERAPLGVSRQHHVAVHKRQIANARAHEDFGNLRSYRSGTDDGRATGDRLRRAT